MAVAADRPLLILVDDLHWTDVASMRFLAYLAKRIADHPVAILVALRPGEADVGDGLVDALVVDCRNHLRLAPLSHDATRTLVEDRLGPAAGAFVDVCHRTTDGNPLLLEQVLGALACESIPPDVSHCDTVRALGSRAISDVVSLRLRRMPADAVAVARSVAVLGADADIGTLVRIADLSDARMLDALDLLATPEARDAVRGARSALGALAVVLDTPRCKQAVAGAVEDICENLRAHRDGDDDRRPPRRPARVPSDTFAEAPSSSDESDRGTPAASPATDALRGLLARHRRRAVAARPRSLCRLVAAGCFLVAVLALSGVGAAFLSYHVLGPRVVRAYNIIVHDEL